MAELIPSIHAWIAEIAQERIKGENESEVTQAGLRKDDIEFVATTVFALPTDTTTMEDILDFIKTTFGEDMHRESVGSLTVIAQICLVYAVSNTCPDRTFFVRCIMNLDGDHQTNLMEIIKDNLQTLFTPQYLTSLSSNEDLTASVAPLDMIAIEPLAGQICVACKDKDELIKQLQSELGVNLAREQANDTKLKAELGASMNRLVDVELAVLDREKQAQVAYKQLEEAETRMKEMEEFLKQHRDKISRLESLQDEVDVLRPLADRAETSEKQVIRLREKLEELADVKQQLKAESQAHEETHSKLVAAELELDATRKYKGQVDEYRAQLTESSIVVQDLTLRAKIRDEQIHALQQQIDQLEAGNRGHAEQAQHLAGELQATTQHLRDIETTGGIGLGMCELNPVLMQELQKLRSENEALLSKLEATSVQSLDKLEKRVADQDCMNASLQMKWMTTSDALQAANQRIANLERELLVLSMQKAILSQEFSESCVMWEEDLQSYRIRESMHQAHQSHISRSLLSLHEQGRTAVVESYATELANTCQQLSSKEADYDQMTVDRDQWKSSHAELETELENTRTDRKRKLDEMQMSIRQLREQHEQDLEEERDKIRVANDMLEDEKNKLRRVDRERRIIEQEMIRYKTQLQTSGGAGTGGPGTSVEVEVALKEFKVMQQQLEEAEAEIRALKTEVGRAGTTESSRNSSTTAASCTPDTEVGPTSNSIARPSRSVRVRVTGDRQEPSASGTVSYGFIDQASSEINDRQLEKLKKEKRELIARSLEENSEKIGLSQKLKQCEQELAVLKSKLTNTTLEKERIERKYNKLAASQDGAADVENIANSTRAARQRTVL